MARPDRYELHVKPYLDKISTMALTMTEEQIADTLHISYSSWKRYKHQHEPLRTALKKGRKELVLELKSALIRKAKGFTYEERKLIKEAGVIVREEIYIKASPPDVAALNLLLKNYDSEKWANDPQLLEIRKAELALKEREIENKEW